MKTETLTPQLDRSHIRDAYQAAPRPTCRMGDRPAPTVWQDVFACFKELFTKQPAIDQINYSEADLVAKMHARFGKKYNAEMIVNFLKNGWEVSKGQFVFKREDFLRETVKREVGVAS